MGESFPLASAASSFGYTRSSDYPIARPSPGAPPLVVTPSRRLPGLARDCPPLGVPRVWGVFTGKLPYRAAISNGAFDHQKMRICLLAPSVLYWSKSLSEVVMPRGEHNRKLSPDTWQRVIREYVTPLPNGTWVGMDTLARKYGVTRNAVSYHVTRAGIPIRDLREAHAHGKRCKPITNLPPAGESAPACKCGCGAPVAWNRRKNRWNTYVAGHYRPERPYHSAEWLGREYVAKHRTTTDIAAEFGVAASSVIKAITRAGIAARSQAESLRLSGGVRGANNPAWKGGTTPERQRVYRSQAWKKSVRAAYLRDGYTCQRCGAPKRGHKGLHAHHIRSWAEYPELRLDTDNLVTLCSRCHAWVHSTANTTGQYLA